MALLNHLFSLSRSISPTNIALMHPLVRRISSTFLSLLIGQTSTNHHPPARRHPIKCTRCYSMFLSIIPVLSPNKLPEELWTYRPISHISPSEQFPSFQLDLATYSAEPCYSPEIRSAEPSVGRLKVA
jgi:hypothetical protein